MSTFDRSADDAPASEQQGWLFAPPVAADPGGADDGSSLDALDAPGSRRLGRGLAALTGRSSVLGGAVPDPDVLPVSAGMIELSSCAEEAEDLDASDLVAAAPPPASQPAPALESEPDPETAPAPEPEPENASEEVVVTAPSVVDRAPEAVVVSEAAAAPEPAPVPVSEPEPPPAEAPPQAMLFEDEEFFVQLPEVDLE